MGRGRFPKRCLLCQTQRSGGFANAEGFADEMRTRLLRRGGGVPPLSECETSIPDHSKKSSNNAENAKSSNIILTLDVYYSNLLIDLEDCSAAFSRTSNPAAKLLSM